MWVFGYGSLMWDGWEQERGCTRRVSAELAGYQRAFNKPSVVRWGTKEHPCPTLTLVKAANSSCRGSAFEFPDHGEQEIRAYLIKREGPGFMLRKLAIRLDDGSVVDAFAAVYEDHDIIQTRDLQELGQKIRAARGKSGTCAQYVHGVARQLEKEGIDDPIVTALAAAVVGSS